ncbi:hypothetical protein Ndes2526A_g00633 [Nannochloris sp. 'desiccata']|nr:hypothetical protein KSW81_003941 [Chlorella desiccata (nom. nud.)]
MSRRYVSRQAQAFESLMAPDSDEEGTKTKGKSKRGSGSTTNVGPKVSVASGSMHTPGFKLRNDHSSQGQQASDRNQTNSNDLDTLVDLFGSTFPTDVIQDILLACGGSQEAAVDALLAMSTPLDKQQQPSPVDAPPPFLPPPPAPTESEQPQHLLPNLWDTLPQECKLLILQYLSLKDLSKAAAISKEFCNHVRSQRQSLRSITVPPGLSTASIRSIVTSFAAAHAVDFSRCGRTLRFPNEFEDVAVAVSRGAADRPSGSASIESISFSKCGELADGDVAAVCAVLRSLKAVDVSKCAKVSDGTLKTLARYRRSSSSVRDDDDEEENEGQDDAGNFMEQLGDTDDEINQLDQSFQETRLESPAAAVERIAAATDAATAARRQSASAAAIVGGGLEEINVSGTDVTSRGVGELLRGSGRAPSLLSLDISRCSKVSGEALVPGPRSLLRVLRASGCTAIRSITLQLSSSRNDLQEIVLTNCKSLKEVVILAGPSLLNLNVSGCAQLTTLSLRCPRLTRLSASGCPRLHIGTFNGATFECPALQDVNFFGCRSLEASNFESVVPLFISVQELDLSGCVALSRIVAVQGEGLRKLRKLIVDGCAVLRHVAVASTELQELSAKACPRLMEVRIVGSVPRRIDFENCGELREVVIGGENGGGGGTGASTGEEQVGGERAGAAVAVTEVEVRGTSFGVAVTEEAKEMRRKLVLRGCDRLPTTVRDNLRVKVLKRVH